MANKLPVYSKFESKTSGQGITDADQIDYGIFKQSVINEKLMSGKKYDAEKKEWVSNELTKATTTTLGGIRAANVREIHNFQTIQGEEDTIGNRYYGVELDKDGKAFVHVPWVYNAIPVADKDKLGGVKTGDNTGIKVEGQIIKADFDDTDYSNIGDMTADDFPTDKVASPDTVKQIFDAYNQVFLDTLGDVEVARLNLYNAIYGTDYIETSQIPVE